MTHPLAQRNATLAAITARLVARHDALTILRAVVDACERIMSADAAGILISDPRGGASVAATSDERARFVEFLQVQTDEGPCLECVTDNTPVVSVELADDAHRWPGFVPAAWAAGFRSAYAFPLRLDSHATGGLNVLFSGRTDLSDDQRSLGQVLADLAVLGLTQERDQRRLERLAEQTLTTLNDRINVGHAVGMLTGALNLAPDDARARLVAYAESTGRSMRDLARALTDGSLAPRLVTDRGARPVRD